MTIIYFILILGITVFIHEFGHFIFAKKFGVHVFEFSIGMGPKIFKFNRKNDETNYCIRLFPIGGFVQMYGEEAIDTEKEENKEIPKEKSLQSKPAYQRLIIMVAGVMMNFILALILLLCIGLFNPVILDSRYVEDSLVDGLEDGSKIVSVDGNFINNYDKLALELTVVGNNNFTMEVEDSKGNKKEVEINPIKVGNSNLLYQKDYGFSVEGLTVSTSSLSSLNKGDKIKSINGTDIKNYSHLLMVLDSLKEDNFEMTIIDSNKSLKDIKINIKENKEDELQGNNYGFYIGGKTEKGLFAAIKYAFFKFFSCIEQMVFTVFYLITGKISLSMMSGPVGIFNAVSLYSSYGFSSLISLLCLICINVGFINILPLPAFDGGHVLFIIIEKIKGSKVSPKIENTIHNVGFILLMILMVLVTYNDIARLF